MPHAFRAPHRRAVVPFLLPVLAGTPIVLCMAIMGLPELAFAHAGIYRVLFATAYVIWSLPLTALQRTLWFRLSPWMLAVVMLAATYLLSVINNTAAQLLALHWGQVSQFSWSRNLRGLDGCWLALIAFCAIHAIVTHAFELRSAEDRLREAEGLTRDAELRALRYQLNPHFLFNTLNAISSLVTEHRSSDATRMLATLGDLLRATLDEDHRHEMTLAEELSTTSLYLDIEKIRLGDRLVIDLRVGADVLRAIVPSLLIQPLAENAIRHGIAQRRTPGRLELRANRINDRLRISLRNEGPTSVAPARDRPKTIGLANVRDRLGRLYGDAHRVDILVDSDGGWTVVIELPFRLEILAPERALCGF